MHFHTDQYYAVLHMPDITITDLDVQESELEGKGYLENCSSGAMLVLLRINHSNKRTGSLKKIGANL